MFALMLAIQLHSAAVVTLPETVVVSDTVSCHTRDLIQGSGSVRICEYAHTKKAGAK